MKSTGILLVLALMASHAHAQTLHLIGYFGDLGEWEMSADLAVNSSDRTKEFGGPLLLRHTGVCTQDGPEEKSGDIRMRLSESRSELQATLKFDGVECRFAGRLSSDRYTGLMSCPDRRAKQLSVWLK
jgi:hypothetical protein